MVPIELNQTRRFLVSWGLTATAFIAVFSLGDAFNWSSPRYFPVEHLWSFTNSAGPGRVAMGLYGLILYAVAAGAVVFGVTFTALKKRSSLKPTWDWAVTALMLAAFTASSLYFCVHLATRELKPVLFP